MTAPKPRHWQRGTFEISTDAKRLDRGRVLQELGASYWAATLPSDLVWKSVEGSVPFGLYEAAAGQIGFARVATDLARFAWISDVYVNDAWQGQGLGAWLMECVLNHPDFQTMRRWMLSTDDAFDFYARFGFERIADSKFMGLKTNQTG